eukprot:CAMPEP_0174915140 /NCGR_PEP_ID=MMETSP1355-20121228/381_1 /TAXON_ID=464990 /ORGANISM="Hemiselmis tepida, Strain CCMP443" /LENGTH=50 /DNA_ID=CAMNT_0016159963 /DNA_START=429 /DNA_END=581 /DNA_ORIENTATION=+
MPCAAWRVSSRRGLGRAAPGSRPGYEGSAGILGCLCLQPLARDAMPPRWA